MYRDLAQPLKIIGQADSGYGHLFHDKGTYIQTKLNIYLAGIAQKHHTTNPL